MIFIFKRSEKTEEIVNNNIQKHHCNWRHICIRIYKNCLLIKIND